MSTAAGRQTRPGGTGGATADGGAAQPVAFLSLLAGVWLALSTFVLPAPFTVAGVDARLREMGLALVVGIFAAGRLRAPSSTPKSAVTIALAGALLAALPFLFGYGPDGSLAARWWNEILTGVAIVATGVAGLAACRRPVGSGTPERATGHPAA